MLTPTVIEISRLSPHLRAAATSTPRDERPASPATEAAR
jgi:hypothetical protein